jgi:hypothetical protein
MGEYLIGCEFVGELFTPINKSATFFGKTVITALLGVTNLPSLLRLMM